MNIAQKHATGVLVILANVAAGLHDQLAGHWPANAHDWTVLILAEIASLGTAGALYGIKPKPDSSHEVPPKPVAQ